MKISWPKQSVVAACVTYAPLVTEIEGIDSRHLLLAMAQKESSMGYDCTPRHEPAWDANGRYASDPQQALLLEQYGRDAACSYGPLQVMFYNAPGYTPHELNTDLSIAMRAAIAYLNKQIRHFSPKTVGEVGQVWNHGSIVRLPNHPSLQVQLYCTKLEVNYHDAPAWLEVGNAQVSNTVTHP
jgi:hypothetical protein